MPGNYTEKREYLKQGVQKRELLARHGEALRILKKKKEEEEKEYEREKARIREDVIDARRLTREKLIEDLRRNPVYQVRLRGDQITKEEALRVKVILNQLREEYAFTERELSLVTGLREDWLRDRRNLRIMEDAFNDDFVREQLKRRVAGELFLQLEKLKGEKPTFVIQTLGPLYRMVMDKKSSLADFSNPLDLDNRTDDEMRFYAVNNHWPEDDEELAAWLKADGGQSEVVKNIRGES